MLAKKLIYNILLFLCVTVFCGSSISILFKIWERGSEDKTMSAVKEVFSLTDTENDAAASAAMVLHIKPDGRYASDELTLAQQAAERQKRLPGYEKLQQQNGDMRGWISIPGTAIDYPVMQSPDRPDFYLTHNFNKEKSSYGTPYLSELCDLSDSSKNIIIYGHHMRNGTMFAELMGYRDKSFYAEHPVIWFDTLEGSNAYEVKAAMTASAGDTGEKIFELAGDGAKRSDFLDEVEKRSLYHTGELTNSVEPLLILITCEYSQDEGRLLVIAQRMDAAQEKEATSLDEATDAGKDEGV